MLGMQHLGVELDPPHRQVAVLERVHRAVGAGGQNLELRGQVAGFVEVRGHGQGLGQAPEQRIGREPERQEAELGLGRLAYVPRAGQDLGQELVAIADAQDGLAGVHECAHQSSQRQVPGLVLGGRGHGAGNEQVAVWGGVAQPFQLGGPEKAAGLCRSLQTPGHHAVEVHRKGLFFEAVDHQYHGPPPMLSLDHSFGMRPGGYASRFRMPGDIRNLDDETFVYGLTVVL